MNAFELHLVFNEDVFKNVFLTCYFIFSDDLDSEELFLVVLQLRGVYNSKLALTDGMRQKEFA